MSTTATGLPPNVATYLAALRAELSDLAADERDDLLAEVEPSLLEAAADGEEPIAGRLGAPADFAADLRASAGLPPKTNARPAGIGRRLRELAASQRMRRARDTARELAPVWRAVRAYIAVGLTAILLGIDWSVQHPALPRFGARRAPRSCSPSNVPATATAGACRTGRQTGRRQWCGGRIAGRSATRRTAGIEGAGSAGGVELYARMSCISLHTPRSRPLKAAVHRRPRGRGHCAGRAEGVGRPGPPPRARAQRRTRVQRLPDPLLRAGHAPRRAPERRSGDRAAAAPDATLPLEPLLAPERGVRIAVVVGH